MNRGQKLILAVLALADLVVIGGLGAYVITHATPPAEIATEPAPRPHPCELALIAGVSQPGDTVTVSLHEGQAYISVTRDASANASAASAQSIWSVLEALSTVPEEACLPAEMLTITVVTSSTGHSGAHGHLAQVAAPDLAAWRRGELTDDEFAQVIRYRSSDPPTN